MAATRGEFLSFAGQPILAAFHSSSGGRTASAAEVWGGDLPYLDAVESPDDDSPDFCVGLFCDDAGIPDGMEPTFWFQDETQ